MTNKQSIIAVDIEASSLNPDSYPIEVAWLDGETGEHDSFMINPSHVDWWTDWDWRAQDIHNIPREELLAKGIQPEEAVERLNQKLSGKVIVSDAVGADSFWLGTLFDEVGIMPAFKMIDVRKVLSELPTEKTDAFIDRYEEYPVVHRALADCVRIQLAGIDIGAWRATLSKELLLLQPSPGCNK